MNKKSQRINDLLEACKIARSCLKKSELLDPEEIEFRLIIVDYSESFINDSDGKISSYQLNSIENELLSYWNNYLNLETEKFWNLIDKNGIRINRKPTFEKIIAQKRFKNVEQAIDVYNDLYTRPIRNYDNEELKFKLDSLYEIVKLDRDKRISQFRKWIRNKRVSVSDRMKFGENYAYMLKTNQLEGIFGKTEQQTIEDLMKHQIGTS